MLHCFVLFFSVCHANDTPFHVCNNMEVLESTALRGIEAGGGTGEKQETQNCEGIPLS